MMKLLRHCLSLMCLIAIWGCARPSEDGYHVLTEENVEAPAGSSSQTDNNAEQELTTQSTPMSPDAPANVSIEREKDASEELTDQALSAVGDTPGESASDDAETLRQQTLARIAATDQEMAELRARALGIDPEAATSSEPREIKLLIPTKEFQKEAPYGALRVTFDDLDLLKVLNMEPVPENVMNYLPDWMKNLDGERIILRGWMFPTLRPDGIRKFMFVRDNGICCFGREPKVYDKLATEMKEGQTTRYIEGRPFDVVATLTIEPEMEGDEVFWLYRLHDAVVLEK